MDAAIAAVLRQAAAAIGEPDRAAHVERVACEARAGDLAYLSGDDSDDSDDDDEPYWFIWTIQMPDYAPAVFGALRTGSASPW